MVLKILIILNLFYQYNVINLNSLAIRSDGNLRTYINTNYARELFEDFKLKYHKKYRDQDEHNRRFQIFLENLNLINDKNAESEGAFFGITQFADQTKYEFWGKHTGMNGTLPMKVPTRKYSYKISRTRIPDNWDWRNYGVVERARNQLECRSCWTFSATGVVYSQLAKLQRVTMPLSTQQMIDCYPLGGGCTTGSFPHLAWEHAAKIGGYMSEEDYPYKGVKQKCRFRKDKVVVRLKGGGVMNIKDEEALKHLVYNYGPVSVGVYASRVFPYYGGGVAGNRELECNATSRINHAVIVIGYGVEETYYGSKPYWTILNSAGDWWGEMGSFRIVRGENTCNILFYVAAATLA